MAAESQPIEVVASSVARVDRRHSVGVTGLAGGERAHAYAYARACLGCGERARAGT